MTHGGVDCGRLCTMTIVLIKLKDFAATPFISFMHQLPDNFNNVIKSERVKIFCEYFKRFPDNRTSIICVDRAGRYAVVPLTPGL